MVEEIITAAILNVDLRDNLLVLSTHAHSGAAGMGNDELAGVDSVAFDDLAASPDAAGELQRKGTNLEWFGAAVVAITEADAVAATASPRTLGTGAQQAAVGNHTHIPSEVSTAGAQDIAPFSVTYSVGFMELLSNLGGNNTDFDVHTESKTPGATSRILVGYAGVSFYGASCTATAKLWLDGVEKESVAIVFGAAAGRDVILDWVASNPSVAAHTFKTTVRSTVAANTYATGSPVRILEVKV